MIFNSITICAISGFLLFASCNSGGTINEDDYANNDDEALCDCYRLKHEEEGINYQSGLDKDFKFWQSKFKQLEHLDFESIENLYMAFKIGQIQIGSDSSEILGYMSNVNRRIINDCINRDVLFGNNQAKMFQDFINAGGLGLPSDDSRESWLIRIEGYLQFFNQFNDGRWMDPIYLLWIREIYLEYKEMLEYESSKAIQDEIEIKEQLEKVKMIGLKPPPPIEEIIITTSPEDK